MVKIYLHYEVEEPEFTMPVAIDVSDARTASDLKETFVEAYNAKFGLSLDTASYVLVSSKKRQLSSGEPIGSLGKLGNDFFLVPRKADGQAQKTAVT